MKFNPSYQRQICHDSGECHFGEYPTLALIRTAYGDNAPVAWIAPQLYDLSEYCGCKDKFSDRQVEECAFIIATEYFYLKISELMLFFHRFKAGRYGKFYGSVDPLVITTSLREFIAERANACERHEREEAARRIDEGRKGAISWEEYCKRNGIDGKENPLKRIREKMTL